jgi:hypothetical protein
MTVVDIRETVLVYKREDYAAWVQGDKSLIPDFVPIPAIVWSQPRKHFGEAFALRHYHETYGWTGSWFYALGPQYPGSERRMEGRAAIERIIPAKLLRRFRDLRADEPRGSGEPDLFLYDAQGSFMFAEVKKQQDRIRRPQLRCIAEILSVFRCPVDIVYLREEHQQYTAKTYPFELPNDPAG